MSRPISSFWPQEDPGIRSKTKVIIERRTENKTFSAQWLDPKTVVESHPGQKYSPIGPQKAKTTPKLSQIKYDD